jgi:hypothetical protein
MIETATMNESMPPPCPRETPCGNPIMSSSFSSIEDRLDVGPLQLITPTFSAPAILTQIMLDQITVALFLLAGITFIYAIAIRQSDPHDEVDKENRHDRRR